MPDAGNGHEPPPDQTAPAGDALQGAVAALVKAAGLKAARRVFTDHPELLTDEADLLFDRLIRERRQQGSGEEAEILSSYRELAGLCRAAGVDRAFEMVEEAIRKGDGKAAGRTLSEKELHALLADNTVAVMTVMPEQRPAWSAELRRLCASAREAGDSPLASLAWSLLLLVEGAGLDEIIELPPEGTCRRTWDQVAAALTSGIFIRTSDADMFATLAAGSLAALTPGPQRSPWLAYLRNLSLQASDLRDEPLVALIAALLSVLNGQPVESVLPGALHGPYLACWEQVRSRIGPSARSQPEIRE
jgi:hypothetical protein